MGKLADTLEIVFKISGLLAVLGFISLRTHLSLLGVGWDTSLGTEKYLTEAYLLVLASAAFLLDYLPILIKIIVACLLIAVLIHKRPFVTRLISRVRDYSWSRYLRLALPVCLLVIAVWLSGQINRDLNSQLVTPYVGHLNGVAIYYTREAFSLIVIFFIAGYGLYIKLGKTDSERIIRFAWQVLLCALLIDAFYMTKYYGATLRDAEYPVANISVKGGKNSLCGLLVLQSDKSLLLWSTADRTGLVTAIPLDEVIAVALGPPMDLKLVVSDAMEDKSTIDCKQLADPAVALGNK